MLVRADWLLACSMHAARLDDSNIGHYSMLRSKVERYTLLLWFMLGMLLKLVRHL
jgi:hypothetical protein